MEHTPIYETVRRTLGRADLVPSPRPPAHPDIYADLCRTLGTPGAEHPTSPPAGSAEPHNGHPGP